MWRNGHSEGRVYIREFVALFCTERRDKRRGFGWEVMDWQRVTNFDKSAENYFGRILLPRSAAARREVGERATGDTARGWDAETGVETRSKEFKAAWIRSDAIPASGGLRDDHVP
jgi:hypothetical protein